MSKNNVGSLAPEFSLTDQHGEVVTLSRLCVDGPVLLVFYPKDFTPVCTKQLCDYRDRRSDFGNLGVQVLGISKGTTASHADFAAKYELPFRLLADDKNAVAKAYGCTSAFMLGGVSRACVLVGRDRIIRYRHIEPTAITRRSSDELLTAINDLRAQKLL